MTEVVDMDMPRFDEDMHAILLGDFVRIHLEHAVNGENQIDGNMILLAPSLYVLVKGTVIAFSRENVLAIEFISRDKESMKKYVDEARNIHKQLMVIGAYVTGTMVTKDGRYDDFMVG